MNISQSKIIKNFEELSSRIETIDIDLDMVCDATAFATSRQKRKEIRMVGFQHFPEMEEKLIGICGELVFKCYLDRMSIKYEHDTDKFYPQGKSDRFDFKLNDEIIIDIKTIDRNWKKLLLVPVWEYDRPTNNTTHYVLIRLTEEWQTKLGMGKILGYCKKDELTKIVKTKYGLSREKSEEELHPIKELIERYLNPPELCDYM